ncbi:MAG: ferredoxin-thioredoxin reductase catalytic domain-containing protein [Candidatus Helarchaeota archaeon]
MPNLEKTREYVEMVSKHRGWPLTPDQEMLEGLIEGLAINLERYGYRSCPCREAWGEKEKDRDIICPCSYAEADINEYGHCFCSLFWSNEYLTKGGKPRSIPERRPIEKIP